MGTFMMQSCIGSFALTEKVYEWNKSAANNKFVNELVFLVFCAVPVYEISLFIDAIVLNSIEFWAGKSPMASVDKVIDGEHGQQYHVKSNASGYDIELLGTGKRAQLLYDSTGRTWAITADGKTTPLVQYDAHGIAHAALPMSLAMYAAVK
jgi:hypothetical protein